MVQQLSTNTFGTAKWIVSATASAGTHTTIAGALTSASSGDTIFIRPGTYTENITLKVGVNLAAYECDATTPNVVINGKCSFTTAGTVSISGICLRTNSDFAIAVTGSAASFLYLTNCFIHALNNTAISFTSSSSGSAIIISECQGDIGTTGIAYFAHSAAGGIRIINCLLNNTGASTTANTLSGTGGLFPNWSGFTNPITTSGTGANIQGSHCVFNCAAINTTALTHNSTFATQSYLAACDFQAGTASAISIGASATLRLAEASVASSNTNVITGSGVLQYSFLTFTSTSSGVNVTTQTPLSTLGTSIAFTPSLQFGGASTGITYSLQTGKYSIVGNILYYWLRLVLTNKGSAVGNATIAGLPFATASDGGSQGASITVSNAITFSGSMLVAANNTSSTVLNLITITSAINEAFITNTAFVNTSDLGIQGWYFLS